MNMVLKRNCFCVCLLLIWLKLFILHLSFQKIPYVQQTETQISLDQAIERQVWVKEYQNTSFSASVKKKKKEQK